MIRRLRPVGFFGGFLLGILATLFAVGDLARLASLVAPAEAQFATTVRIMDGAHSQLASVDHAGQLLVSLGDASINIKHISSMVHISGSVDLARIGNVSQSGANVVDTANASFRVSQAGGWNVAHIGAAVHIVGAAGAAVHIQGLGTPGASHGGVLTIQGITGGNAVSVAQSTANWTIAHISAQLHLANTGVLNSLSVRCVNTGATAFESCGGGTGSGDAVNVFHQSTVRHISSVTHIGGGVFVTSQAGTVVTVTGTALDVNCTGCSAASVVAVTHISGTVHVVSSFGKALHIQGLGVPGASHGGVLTVQGITGMNPVDVQQGSANWNIAHIAASLHIANTTVLNSLSVRCVNTGATAFESCAGSGSGDAVNVFHQSTIRHISSVVHVVGYAGAALHIQGIGLPGAAHGGVVSIQGVGGMIAVSVSQSIASWTVAHVTSVTHVAGTVSVVARDGTYAGFAGTSILVASSSAQSGSWTVQAAHQGGEWNVRHVSTVVHVSAVGRHYATGVESIHVSGISNVGSGAQGTGTTAMVCHTTLAVHVAASAPGFTQLIHLTSTNAGVDQTAWRIYICGIVLISAHAQSISLVEGTGTTCATGQRPVMGSIRVDDSMIMAGNGGISSVAAFPWISTQRPGNNLCIAQTSRTTGTVSGVITYRAGP